MICWSTIETVCPMCGCQLHVREVGGCEALGQDTDLLIHTKAPHVIRVEIHSCPDCRFSGYSRDFLGGRIAALTIEAYFREYIEKLEDEFEADRSTGDPPTHLQYYWAGLLSPLLGYAPLETGMRMLRAYWSLRLDAPAALDENTVERLRHRYLRQAIAYLRKSLRKEKDPVYLYLVGELCRRNGNWMHSQNYFNRFIARSTRPRHLRNAAAMLIQRARRRDSSHLSMDSLLYPTRDQSRTTEAPEEDRGA